MLDMPLELYNRIEELGSIVNDILRILINSEGGCYHDELLKNLQCSDTSFRPVITALYTTCLIDKVKRGTMVIYKINDYGTQYLNNKGAL